MNSQNTTFRLLYVGQKSVFNGVIRINYWVCLLACLLPLKLIRRILIGFIVITVIAGGKLTSSISDVLTASSHCGSYCDFSGKLVPGQQCGPQEVCCGSIRSRRCCSASSLEAAIVGLTNSVLSEDFRCPEVDEDDVNEDDQDHVRDPREYPATTKASTGFETVVQWWWFVVPLLTIVFLIVLLSMCYCVRHKGSQVDALSELRSGTIPSRANSRRPSIRDFNPNAECAFAPPAYDTLLKNPPTYDEIYPSVHESFWVYDVIEDSPSLPASRRSSLLPPRYEDHHRDSPPTSVTMTPEPPYIEVIY